MRKVSEKEQAEREGEIASAQKNIGELKELAKMIFKVEIATAEMVFGVKKRVCYDNDDSNEIVVEELADSVQIAEKEFGEASPATVFQIYDTYFDEE